MDVSFFKRSPWISWFSNQPWRVRFFWHRKHQEVIGFVWRVGAGPLLFRAGPWDDAEMRVGGFHMWVFSQLPLVPYKGWENQATRGL